MRGNKKHRIVVDEPDIPFEYRIIYCDENIIAVDKPHFLPVTPRGMWHASTALIRLRRQFDNPDITPAHRLDRATAGIVIFVRRSEARRAYQMLFQNREVSKMYECVSAIKPVEMPKTGVVRKLCDPSFFPLERMSRIVKKRGIMQAFEQIGPANAKTVIETVPGTQYVFPQSDARIYRLYPETGKTHQLRVHMNSLGLPIAGDDLYPKIIERAYDDFSSPLQLVARKISFADPFSGKNMSFESDIPLQAP